MIGKSSIPVLAIIVGWFLLLRHLPIRVDFSSMKMSVLFLAGKELLQSLTLPAKEISPSVTSDISSDVSGTLAKRSVLADQYSLSNGAETSLSEIKSQNIKVKESMNKFGDTVTSTDIELKGIKVNKMEGGKIYATYTVDYTRYMPSLPDGKSWKERINYDLVLSTDDRQIISLAQKDEQYFLHHRSSDLQLLNSLPGENERDESAKQLKSIKSVPNVDRDAIVRYAYRYVFDHNPEYVDFTYPNHQDCTNFVSQALHAGGWQKNWEWTANDVQATASWAVANDFDAYAWRQGYIAEAYPYTGFIPPSGMRSVRQGDIILYSTDDSTTDHITWQHAMIVTSFYNYEPYLTYHSNDIRDKPYSAVIAAVP